MKPDRDQVIMFVAELDENPIAGSRLDRDGSQSGGICSGFCAYALGSCAFDRSLCEVSSVDCT